MTNKIERRLAAVMFTDVVDFTTLMSRDESEALNVLQQKINIVQSEVNNCNGIYIKDIGDGTLSFFESATKAVDCALEIQESLKVQINIRIGIHLGEIVYKNGAWISSIQKHNWISRFTAGYLHTKR